MHDEPTEAERRRPCCGWRLEPRVEIPGIRDRERPAVRANRKGRVKEQTGGVRLAVRRSDGILPADVQVHTRRGDDRLEDVTVNRYWSTDNTGCSSPRCAASRRFRCWSSFVTGSTSTAGDSRPRGLGSETASRSVPRNLYLRRLESSTTTDVRSRVGSRGGDDHAPRAAGTERARGARSRARGRIVSPERNGVYDDPETPVRTTSHWLTTFSNVYEITDDEYFAEAANDAADYLLSEEARSCGWPYSDKIQKQSADETTQGL